MPASRTFDVTNGLFVGLGVLSAALQLNDPDPVLWSVVYGVAAVLWALYAWRPVPAWPAAVFALACIAWASTLLHALRGATPNVLWQSMDPAKPGIEEARELGGLFILASWSLVWAWRRRPGRSVVNGL